MKPRSCECRKLSCKVCYDYNRRAKIKEGTWKVKPEIPTSLTTHQKEILDGGLLGDSSLFLYKNAINAGLHTGRQGSDSKYLWWEYEQFKEFCLSPPKLRDSHDKRTKKTYKNIAFRTRCLPLFTQERQRWYTSQGTKILPDDLVLSPLTCAVWFADDGSVKLKVNKNGTLGMAMILYTDGFTAFEVKRLCSLLSETIGAEVKTSKHEDKLTLRCGIEASEALALYIDPVFPSSMSRKSDTWRRFLESRPMK